MYDELTPSDIRKMEDEIEYRVHIVRKKALDDVKEARAQGDLSENFEYYAAKKFKNQNESRIRYLQRMIKTATVISEESADDEAGVNNTVEVKYEDDGSTEKIKLVTTVRGDSLEGLKCYHYCSCYCKALAKYKCIYCQPEYIILPCYFTTF